MDYIHGVKIWLPFLLVSFYLCSAAHHSLQYITTGVTPGINFPEYTVVGMVDGQQFVYYDSNIKKMIPKTEWIEKIVADDSDYWDRQAQSQEGAEEIFKANLNILMQRFNQTKVRPEISVFQRDSSSSVVCHATGFFPKAVMITWQKNGEDLYGDVELRETVPNQDGTFQKRSVLTVSPEDLKNNQYTCVVQHSSLREDLIRKVEPGGGVMGGVIVGVVVAVLLIVLVATCVGVVVWKKKKSEGFKPVSALHFRASNPENISSDI